MKKSTQKANKTKRFSDWFSDAKAKVKSTRDTRSKSDAGSNKTANVRGNNSPSRVIELTIHSDVLKQKRSIIIGLPKSYHCQLFSPQQYPVIYLLDAEKHFQQLRSMLDVMSNSDDGNYQIPEVILVGINNIKSASKITHTSLNKRTKSINLDRLRNMTPTKSLVGIDGRTSEKFAVSGGAAEFTRFIKKELVPRIDKSYRTSDYRLLLGHSLGGLFGLSCYLEQPNFFNATIALDPSIWWDDYVIAEQFKSKRQLQGRLFLAAANNPQLSGFNERLVALSATIEQIKHCQDLRNQNKRNQDLQNQDLKNQDNRNRNKAEQNKPDQSKIETTDFEFREFLDEDHLSLPLVGSYYGLLSVFSGFKIPHLWTNLPDAEMLISHFVKFNQKHNLAFLPSEQMVNKLALKWLHVDQDKALALFELNIKNHPDSSDAYYSIGITYQELGQMQKAKQAYRIAMELNHLNEEVAARLEALEDKEG